MARAGARSVCTKFKTALGNSACTCWWLAATLSSELKKQLTRNTSAGSPPEAFNVLRSPAKAFAVSGGMGSSGFSE